MVVSDDFLAGSGGGRRAPFMNFNSALIKFPGCCIAAPYVDQIRLHCNGGTWRILRGALMPGKCRRRSHEHEGGTTGLGLGNWINGRGS